MQCEDKREGLARTIRGQKHKELSFLCLSDELWVCTILIIVFVVQLGKNAPL
jgi:hypothetical protein